MTSKEELEALAAQLRQPQGAKGIEIAHMMHETNINMSLHAMDRLQIQDGQVLLELGHGNCGHLPYLLKQGDNLSYYGLELSALMQEEAQGLNEAFIREKRAAFYLYDGQHIPFADNFFDRVFTVNTIYFWQDPPALLSALYRVIKPGGLLNITFAHKSFMQQLPFTAFGFALYDEEQLSALVATTAFSIAGSDTQTEIVRSKTGEEVKRNYTTLTLMK